MFYLENKVISPLQRFKPDLSLPRHAIFCHHPSTFYALKHLESKGLIYNVNTKSHKLTTFRSSGLEIALIHAYFGATAALHRLFEFYVKGVTYFIDIAAAGSLNDHLKIGDIVLVNKAIRDDGLSDLFASKNEAATSDIEILDSLANTCIRSNIEFKISTTWTAQSIYGYSKEKYVKMKENGVQCVESESASLLIGAKWLTQMYEKALGHKALAASMLYISDILPNANNSWNSELDLPKKLIDYKEKCLGIAIKAHCGLAKSQTFIAVKILPVKAQDSLI